MSKIKNMKKTQIGIWLDFRTANIITLKEKKVDSKTIHSKINTSKPKGGSSSSFRWGSTDTISEKHYLERRKNEERAYYEEILEVVKAADELFIFGPAEAKNGLLKAIKAHKSFKPIFKGIETADSMTDNQKVAKVRAFFSESNI